MILVGLCENFNSEKNHYQELSLYFYSQNGYNICGGRLRLFVFFFPVLKISFGFLFEVSAFQLAHLDLPPWYTVDGFFVSLYFWNPDDFIHIFSHC